MEMGDRHHRVRPHIHHHPEAALADALFLRHHSRDAHEVANRRLVAFLQVVDRGHMLVRHDEHMDRCPRLDVVEGRYLLVSVDDAGWDGAADDAAEEAVIHAISP